MKMIKAVVRPERSAEVLEALRVAGYPAATKFCIHGRGKQQGLKIGTTHYDEIPKDMIMTVVADENVDEVTKVIVENARTGKTGTYGDGKIFILPVERCIKISSGKDEL
ncbi:nitrogen regulatory protein P-II family [Ruminococcus sp. YE71]|uniref:P-II family nitrogen regulator n=1 Tax=unclassified Ruminococcus TaxID=2608920 RepID=UPI0008815776|nr:MULTISPECIES: P-II family nitrogen regulator [unclassified Ruminococcus]SDA25962.1 nitrogen regulatory protein P-II family [Ruminococcus sp. YE78]SFW35676.1 nitrogen regulatory protein P-II family [Ruminococcus sp. YE71]